MSRWPVAGPSECWLLASSPASKVKKIIRFPYVTSQKDTCSAMSWRDWVGIFQYGVCIQSSVDCSAGHYTHRTHKLDSWNWYSGKHLNMPVTTTVTRRKFNTDGTRMLGNRVRCRGTGRADPALVDQPTNQWTNQPTKPTNQQPTSENNQPNNQRT